MFVRRTVAALVGAALLLAGCSDDPEPRFAPPSESPSPSESATSAEPEPQSPEEFIREWVALDTAMQNTGEADAYLEVSADCGACADFAERIQRNYARGGYVETLGWQIRSIRLESQDPSVYYVRVNSRPTTVVESEGAEPKRFPGGEAVYGIAVRRSGPDWRVVDLYEVSQ